MESHENKESQLSDEVKLSIKATQWKGLIIRMCEKKKMSFEQILYILEHIPRSYRDAIPEGITEDKEVQAIIRCRNEYMKKNIQ